MSRQILGIHHVTAIAGDPQQNVDFYTDVLGLRLLKLTVNFDDPGTYHLYFGDEIGHPGTILTFFPWPGRPPGRHGTGQATAVAFAVPEGALGYWTEQLTGRGLEFEGPDTRFDEELITLSDPDGLQLELVATSRSAPDSYAHWREGPVPVEHAIRGFYGITLAEADHDHTASLLAGTLGFRPTQEAGNRFRYEVGDGGRPAMVDVLAVPDGMPGYVSVGTIHHVAFRTPDDEEQKAWRQEIVEKGVNVTPVIDRQYFHSIYFHEPGGVLFEIATDPPGFTIDEPREQLGTHFLLPSWLEPRRAELERQLPRLRLPETGGTKSG